MEKIPGDTLRPDSGRYTPLGVYPPPGVYRPHRGTLVLSSSPSNRETLKRLTGNRVHRLKWVEPFPSCPLEPHALLGFYLRIFTELQVRGGKYLFKTNGCVSSRRNSSLSSNTECSCLSITAHTAGGATILSHMNKEERLEGGGSVEQTSACNLAECTCFPITTFADVVVAQFLRIPLQSRFLNLMLLDLTLQSCRCEFNYRSQHIYLSR
jgi:hypothetical protein